MIGAKPAIEQKVSKGQEEFEFAGNFFLVRVEGEEGSLERAYRSLTRLGITLPIERERLSKTRSQRVNIRILFHNGENNRANNKFTEWAIEKVIPKVEQIQSNQRIKEKSRNFKEKEAETTVEISAAGNRGNTPIAVYKGKI
ncbi:hypothetical protein [Allocoleopsis sp.]|uniref:hypothetical protein n=1 Tax=Allocoleopsis sp. TaxID=3088169 RepID=UPI002FD0F4AA